SLIELCDALLDAGFVGSFGVLELSSEPVSTVIDRRQLTRELGPALTQCLEIACGQWTLRDFDDGRPVRPGGDDLRRPGRWRRGSPGRGWNSFLGWRHGHLYEGANEGVAVARAASRCATDAR